MTPTPASAPRSGRSCPGPPGSAAGPRFARSITAPARLGPPPRGASLSVVAIPAGPGVVVGLVPVPSRPAPAGFARSPGDPRDHAPGRRPRGPPDDLDARPRGSSDDPATRAEPTLDRPCAHMRLSDDPATRAEPPPRRGGANEERDGDRFAAPVREIDADERTGAGPRTPARARRRVGPRHRVRNHRPEDPHGYGDEAGDNSAWGSLAEDRGHGDEPRPGEPRCAGATSDHPQPRPARLLRPFRSATPLHPSLYEEKGRSGGAGGVAERKRRSRG